MAPDEGPTQELRELLDRLGEAVRTAMLEDPQIRRELAELRSAGWEANVRFEARLTVVDRSGARSSGERDLKLTVAPTASPPGFQLDRRDVRWLQSIGITAGRYRSPASWNPGPGDG